MSAHADGTEWLEITPEERVAMHKLFDLNEELDALLEANPMTCYFKQNYFSGHAPQHKRLCFRADCGEDATHHISSTGWCANSCQRCAIKLLRTHPRAEITENVYLAEGAQV